MKPKTDGNRDILPLIDPTKKIEVYRNLHTGRLSVRQSGIVICHTLNIVIRDAEFVVRKAGRLRVIREEKKNVHAFVRGYLADVWAINNEDQTLVFEWPAVTYDPYKDNGFVEVDTGKVVTRAKYVDIDAPGSVLTFGAIYETQPTNWRPTQSLR